MVGESQKKEIRVNPIQSKVEEHRAHLQIQGKNKIQDNLIKGELFEDLILSLLSSYFTPQPRTQPFPDYLIKFNPTRDVFAIECKWREKLYENSYNIKEKDFINYKEYQSQKNIPFFMILGLGGTPSKPFRIFIVPLEKFNHPCIKNYDLTRFMRTNPYKPFYYDTKQKLLS